MALPFSPRISNPYTLSAGQTGPLTQDWPLYAEADLVVLHRRGSEVTEFEWNIDFTIEHAVDESGRRIGFSITLVEPALEGDRLVMIGQRSVQNVVTLTSERGATPAALNRAMDIAYAQMQEAAREAERSFKTDFFDPTVFDLGGRRITNIAPAVDEGDVLTLGAAQTVLADAANAAAEAATAIAVAAAETATEEAGIATGAAGAATGAAGAAAGAAGAAGAAQEAAEAAQMAAEAAAASSLLLDGSRPMTGPIVLSEISAPDAPAAGRMALYTKSNQKLYYKDAAGAEVEIGGGTSDRLTPAMFGAAGDGIADDSEAIANALGVAVSAGLPLDLGGADKTYLLDDWEAWGHEPAGPIKIASQGALVKGPAGGAYFLRPGTVFEISNTRFDRWTGVVDARSADEGEISGARFEGNACTNISGIPFNVECEFRDGHVGRNRFANCTGGYIIRIGDNDYARQNEWSGNIIEQNIIRSVTASGETSLFAIIVYGRDTLILGNDLRDLASTNGECIGIYTKLRNSRVIGNSVRNLSSSGGSGAALDVVGISMKGARRNVTNSGPQGYDMTCIGNTVIGVGAQNVKGTGIRAQISDAIVANNIINDVGLIGVNVDDSNGSVSVGVCDNHIRGFNMLGVTGIMVSTYGSGHRVTGNSVIDFQRCVRVEGISPNSVAGVKVTGNHLKFLNNGASIYIGDFVGSLTMFGNSHEGTGNQAVLWSGTPAKAIQQQEDFTMCTVTNVNGGTPTNPLTGGSNLVP